MVAKRLIPLLVTALLVSAPIASAADSNAGYAVAPQYDTTHVYVEAKDFDSLVKSLVSTFGGKTTKAIVLQVTPTKSQTRSQLVLTPSGSLSVFGFLTPIPYPFGAERNGYLVQDMDAATRAAMATGAIRLISTFPDPVGRDVVVQWPGGVNMQLYWHTKAPDYPALKTAPENRLYLTPEAADRFIAAWTHYSDGKIVSDDRNASGAEVGDPTKKIRRVVIESGYGPAVVLVSDGILPWPFGRDETGYGVASLDATLSKAKAAGVQVIVAPYQAAGRRSAIVRFPGGYVAEIHETGNG